MEIEQGNVVVNASKLPALIGVVGAAGLEHGHGCKFQSSELNHTLCLVKCSNISGVLVAPLVSLSIPNGNLDLGGVFAHVDILRNDELDLDTDIGGDMCRSIRVWDVTKALLDS